MKLISVEQHACQQRFFRENSENLGFWTVRMKKWRAETLCHPVWHRCGLCQPLLAPAVYPPGPGAREKEASWN
ncbi:hypothetical protein [Noviherbaspirillum soli]|uniref:hypothetical protein n=1 Tax=Noviherbaspirillum soli TaxID=1064518 RepID=UPI001E4B7768|nr:hypothetical protein [Noviherbaspirillum soli]